MMAVTHALAGAALASVLALGAPEFALVAVLAAFVGGIAPDIDLAWTHRRTLHFPVYAPLLALPVLVLAVLFPTAATVAGAAFLGAVALHSVSDVFGGGLELRPWEATSDRAVYNHHSRRWHAPLRWVRYDGSPEDLLLSSVLAIPVVVFTPEVTPLVALSLGVAAVYALGRKRLVDFAERHADRFPKVVRTRLL